MNSSRPLRVALLSACLALTVSPFSRAEMPDEEMTALRVRAESGDPIAQHNLGLKYADAKDKYFNLVESYAWLRTAAAHGAAGNALAFVERQLSAEQRSQGDTRQAEIEKTLASKSDAGPAPGVSDSPVAASASDAAGEYKKLSDELSSAWKENDLLKAELGRLRAASANFEGERNALLQKVNAAESAAATAVSQAKAAADAQASSARSSAGVDAAKAAEELKSLKAQFDESQLKLEAALSSFNQQQKETDRVQKALVAVESERSGLADKVAQLERDAGLRKSAPAPTVDPALSIRAQAAEAALVSARQERDQFKSDALGLQSQLELARNEIASLRGSLASATVPAPAAAAPTPAPESAPAPAAAPAAVDEETAKALADAQMKLEISLRSFAVQREEVDRLKERIAALESDKAGLESRVQAATAQVNDTTSRADAGDRAAAELARVQEQLRQTQNQLATVATENMQMRDRLSLAPRASSGALMTAPTRPSPAATPTPAPVARTHQIQPGDTLSRIARRYLGSAERWHELVDANPGLDPAKLSIGATIRIP